VYSVHSSLGYDALYGWSTFTSTLRELCFHFRKSVLKGITVTKQITKVYPKVPLGCVAVVSCEWVCQVAWLDVKAFDCCTCLYVCIASAVSDFLISAVWRQLTNKRCASSSVWDWVKREVKLLKCCNRLLVIRAWAITELLSGLDVSRMAELRLLMMIDQVGQVRQQPPHKCNRYGRLSIRIVVVPYTISVQRLELVMDLVSEFSQNSWACIRLQQSLCRECWPTIRKTVK